MLTARNAQEPSSQTLGIDAYGGASRFMSCPCDTHFDIEYDDPFIGIESRCGACSAVGRIIALTQTSYRPASSSLREAHEPAAQPCIMQKCQPHR
jgi:hypothetical protein